jgi:hypothetical protein
MKAKLEDLKKRDLIEMVKSLWIERKLKHIENIAVDRDSRIDLLEEMILEIGLEIDKNIFDYFAFPIP